MSGESRDPPRPVRIVDVAREAGVSPMTVSNVVNERPLVADETRRRVLAAIERTGYRPHRAAVSLRTRRSLQLGLHVPRQHLSAVNAFSVTFMAAVIESAERHGRQLVVLTHTLEGDGLDRTLTTTGVDGFVLFNVDPADPRPRALADAGIPFAVFGRTAPDLPQTWVDIDNAAAMADVARHLLARGHRRVAYVGFDEPEYWNAERLRGAREALAAGGVTVPSRWLLLVDAASSAPRAVADRLFGHDRPDAIICASDSLALVVLAQAARLGIRVGVDVAVTGFDALPLPVVVEPVLTSVEMPLTAAADACVRTVIALAEGEPAPQAGAILPTRLRLGERT